MAIFHWLPDAPCFNKDGRDSRQELSLIRPSGHRPIKTIILTTLQIKDMQSYLWTSSIQQIVIERKIMTIETDTNKVSAKDPPTKTKRKRASRSSSSGSSSSGSSSSSSATSRSTSSSSSNSSSSSSRSSSAASSPEKKKAGHGGPSRANNKPSSAKKSVGDDKPSAVPAPDTSSTLHGSSPPASRRQEKEATKIYVGKLSLNVNRDHLAEIFGTFGEIKDIDLASQRAHSHLHRGYAYIEYVLPNGAEQACKFMEGGQIDGREIVCALVHGQAPHVAEGGRARREPSPYNRRRRSPLPSRRYPPQRRGGGDRGDRGDRDRPRYNERRGYSPPSRNNRRGQSPPPASRRPGTGGNVAESPKKKERRYSRSSSSESK